jgi:DNA-binding MarR family transcriptional regulator
VRGMVQMHILFILVDEATARAGLVGSEEGFVPLFHGDVANECNVSRTSIERAINDLVEREVIKRIPGASPRKWRYRAEVETWGKAAIYGEVTN